VRVDVCVHVVHIHVCGHVLLCALGRSNANSCCMWDSGNRSDQLCLGLTGLTCVQGEVVLLPSLEAQQEAQDERLMWALVRLHLLSSAQVGGIGSLGSFPGLEF
jgi:hypothetical protein